MSSHNRRASPADIVFGVAGFSALGAALLLATGQINTGSSQVEAEFAAAMVNDRPVPRAEYVRAVDAMQNGLTRELTDADKSKALNMLITEELIVQEALRLGLAENDRLVRKNLVQAMMRSVTSLDVSEPSDEELRTLYEDNKILFSVPASYSIQTLKVSDEAGAAVFKAHLAGGGDFAAFDADMKRESLPGNIPLGKVNDLLGGAAAATVSRMQVGDIAGPVQSGGALTFLWLTAKSGGESDFETMRDQVRAEYVRRAEEAALDAYAARLKKAAKIEIYAEP